MNEYIVRMQLHFKSFMQKNKMQIMQRVLDNDMLMLGQLTTSLKKTEEETASEESIQLINFPINCQVRCRLTTTRITIKLN